MPTSLRTYPASRRTFVGRRPVSARYDPSNRLRTGNHHPRLCPASDADRRRRQDVHADGADRHHGVGLGICPLTHFRAGDARNLAAEAGRGEGRADYVLAPAQIRSEGQKSELKSLMRITYAVLCLKLKLLIRDSQTHNHNPLSRYTLNL